MYYSWLLHNKLKDTTIDEKERKELQMQKTHHETKASTFFADLKEKTKLSGEDESVKVLTFDYQQNLPLPKVSSGSMTSVCLRVKSTKPIFSYMIRLQPENHQMRLYVFYSTIITIFFQKQLKCYICFLTMPLPKPKT